MIQFNLLPDVKLEYIKAQRTHRLVISLSALITIGSIALLCLLLGVNGLQSKHLSDLDNDIKKSSDTLNRQPDIQRVLTVQNQLSSLTDLHDAKPATTRILNYLNQITPTEVSINDFNIDMTQQTITITGTANSLSSVNKYVDTVKFTTYKTDDNAANAFSSVVLSSYGVSGSGEKPASFTIGFVYDPMIFDITKNVQLTVPTLTTTRSELNDTSDLFEQGAQSNTSGGTQ